eukprot:CAMPEP_0184292836 /NCGR_PEP_ID=MMETSP1049-20130417/4518_1 /TAXON_ID=77928 /ORGANISM="Proteomonas sulcata, Strain CCMP704" /LENGTH=52 /DNA_ID=CAMNT_0026600737 /DNA_START=11 /DNA_END=165 /DNA_ORIENTATION=+
MIAAIMGADGKMPVPTLTCHLHEAGFAASPVSASGVDNSVWRSGHDFRGIHG